LAFDDSTFWHAYFKKVECTRSCGWRRGNIGKPTKLTGYLHVCKNKDWVGLKSVVMSCTTTVKGDRKMCVEKVFYQ